MGFRKHNVANLEGFDEPLFLLGVDPWMLLRVVKDEEVPEDGLDEYQQLGIAIFVHNLNYSLKSNGSMMAI